MANKNRKCKFCKDYKLAAKGVKYPIGWFCCQQHALNFASEQTSRRITREKTKAKQVRAKEIKTNRKAVIELNRKTLSWQHKQTQKAFNKLRRLQELNWFNDRGLEPVCISCGKPLGGDQWCNGHFKSVGANGRLRYDFMNSYLQHNNNCNKHLSGDAKRYDAGLVIRFGKKEAKRIIDYCETNNKPIKRTWQDLEELRSGFNKLIKELQNDS